MQARIILAIAIEQMRIATCGIQLVFLALRNLFSWAVHQWSQSPKLEVSQPPPLYAYAVVCFATGVHVCPQKLFGKILPVKLTKLMAPDIQTLTLVITFKSVFFPFQRMKIDFEGKQPKREVTAASNNILHRRITVLERMRDGWLTMQKWSLTRRELKKRSNQSFMVRANQGVPPSIS